MNNEKGSLLLANRTQGILHLKSIKSALMAKQRVYNYQHFLLPASLFVCFIFNYFYFVQVQKDIVRRVEVYNLCYTYL